MKDDGSGETDRGGATSFRVRAMVIGRLLIAATVLLGILAGSGPSLWAVPCPCRCQMRKRVCYDRQLDPSDPNYPWANLLEWDEKQAVDIYTRSGGTTTAGAHDVTGGDTYYCRWGAGDDCYCRDNDIFNVPTKEPSLIFWWDTVWFPSPERDCNPNYSPDCDWW